MVEPVAVVDDGHVGAGGDESADDGDEDDGGDYKGG